MLRLDVRIVEWLSLKADSVDSPRITSTEVQNAVDREYELSWPVPLQGMRPDPLHVYSPPMCAHQRHQWVFDTKVDTICKPVTHIRTTSRCSLDAKCIGLADCHDRAFMSQILERSESTHLAKNRVRSIDGLCCS